MIQRVIDEDTWKRYVEPELVHGKVVTFTNGPKTIEVYQDETGIYAQVIAPQAGALVKVKEGVLAQIKAAYSMPVNPAPSEHLTTEPTGKYKTFPGDGFAVTEMTGERLTMVHHTADTDGKNPHLTMENAHVLTLQDLFAKSIREANPKEADKRKVNDRLLKDYKIPSVDNLNFYPAPESKGRKKGATDTVHASMPLSGYIAFVVHALEVGGVRPEYGARIQQLADAIAAHKGLDTTKLFLRVGMDERVFIRAVMAIDALMPTGSKLPLTARVRGTLGRWWTVEGNTDPVPYLPAAEVTVTPAPKDPSLVRAGDNTRGYVRLETDYAAGYFKEVADAVNTFTIPDDGQ